MVASWPLAADGRVDLAVVDDLARLHLSARRLGYAVRLRHAAPDLSALLRFVGLAEVLQVDGQVDGQAEDGEEGGVEEVVVADDPVA